MSTPSAINVTVGGVTFGKPQKGSDAIFLGVGEPKDLKKIVAMKALLQKAGALWLIRPKRAGAAVTERETMAAGKA
jgi:hydroxymethylglutaryl-CoA reductase